MASALFESLTQHFLHPSDAVAERIEQGIEKYRKGDALMQVVDHAGKRIPGVHLDIRQISHQFYFGANSFMVEGYPTEKENQRWSEAYTRLFNHTVVPFYWAALEPEPGKVRFAADSEPVFRRPPPDLVLQWCEANQITPKGHNLIWHILWPDWMPNEPEQQWPLIEKHFREIAERYGNSIFQWDIANEVLDRSITSPLPPGYLPRSYQLAGALFPAKAQIFVNETTRRSWQDFHRDTSPYYLMIDWMMRQGLRVDGIGMQYHLFRLLHEWADEASTILNPAYLLDVLDLYAAYQMPVHVSEITVPAAGEVGEEGERIQAELVRGLYRTWFSHPSVEAIVWWNLADGVLWGKEGRFNGSLMRPDLSAKPSYEVLDELINSEWKTKVALVTDRNGSVQLHGFYGSYEIRVDGKLVHSMTLDRRSENVTRVVLK
jgi:GH35 family endo-1,4-beta-xylanase